MKTVIVAGLLGGVVLIVWTFVVNGLFGFQSRIDMNQIAAEREVYEVLKEHFVQPGRYLCNPAPAADGRGPTEGPVFSVLYSGVGHESAGSLMLSGLLVFLIAPLIGAWLLSQTSRRVRASYLRKVLFFVAIGLLLAVFTDIPKFGIGNYRLADALAFAANNLLMWTIVGLVVAWRIRPMENDRP